MYQRMLLLSRGYSCVWGSIASLMMSRCMCFWLDFAISQELRLCCNALTALRTLSSWLKGLSKVCTGRGVETGGAPFTSVTLVVVTGVASASTVIRVIRGPLPWCSAMWLSLPLARLMLHAITVGSQVTLNVIAGS